MSLLVDDYMYMQAIAQQRDIQTQKSILLQRKIYINNVNSQLLAAENKLDSGSEGYKILDMRQQQMNQMAQVLDAEVARLTQQEQANSAILQSTKQRLDTEIKDRFSF